MAVEDLSKFSTGIEPALAIQSARQTQEGTLNLSQRSVKQKMKGQTLFAKLHRAARVKCPIHGIAMPQIGVSNDKMLSFAECPRKDCDIKVAVSEKHVFVLENKASSAVYLAGRAVRREVEK